uniref:2-(3-amino-3-carboxypropyl)histidine synthase subunit 1 n=1 Tax=Erigeron canadensis TaxID=72917 RepID=UPI001CB999EA|nr:2-(3-amino-3-carboxypropyl)histidine synthase subunit 1 [Erigeron canadensis]
MESTNLQILQQPPQTTITPPRQPKRFIKNQIPDSITNNPSLTTAISLLPSNYNFEIHKSIWRVQSTFAKRVALQFPEGLLMYSLIISDIITTFTEAENCFVLGDVTYGACCVDDLSAHALGADLLIHYGHSCLVPVDHTVIPCLYIFVDIKIDINRLVETVKLNLDDDNFDDKNSGSDLICESRSKKSIIVAGTIQFGTAIRGAKTELEKLGFRVLVPQTKPLSAGEVLGCTAPTVRGLKGEDMSESVLVFVADGRFHLEAFMIANPKIKAFRYDPYMGKLFLEEYDHKGMKECRMNAIMKARKAKNWGIVLGTLGRQGNPRILDRLEKKMGEKGMSWTIVLMSELSPTRIALFGDSVDAWIQIACPRLSIDWGDAFVKPLLTTFEAEIALGDLPGWWEKKTAGKNDSDLHLSSGCNDGGDCCRKSEKCCGNNDGGLKGVEENDVDYPMDYYSQDGGEWNSCYSKKPTRPLSKNNVLKQ